MRNIKLMLEYDGTNYHGWQIQPKATTVSGTLEKALEVLTGLKIRVVGASRTDAGAHASGQAANFKTEFPSIPTDKFARALNSVLPKDIVVTKAEEIALDFHARFSARDRTYQYLILNRPFPSAIRRRYTHWVPQPLNLEQMREAAQFLIGRHDFTSFSSSSLSKESQNPYRNVKELRIADFGFQITDCGDSLRSTVNSPRSELEMLDCGLLTVDCFADCGSGTAGTMQGLEEGHLSQEGKLIRIHIKADAFLPNMIRAIVGTLIEVGQAKRPADEVREVLAAKNRSLAGPTVPASGLCLMKVNYSGWVSSSINRGEAM